VIRAVEQKVVRVPAGDDRPEGDLYWQGYVPRARLHIDGWDLVELAAVRLEGMAPVSHPIWCSPELCDVWDWGHVAHVADHDPSMWISLVRFDTWEGVEGYRWCHQRPKTFLTPHPIPDGLITQKTRARIHVIGGDA
jgi:hypothetical protein